MRKILIFLMVFLFLINLTSCMKSDDIIENSEDIMPVKIVPAVTTLYSDTLSYIGSVSPEQIKKLSFKSAGKINKIYVEKGQKITKGTTLAVMDTSDYTIIRDGALSQLEAATIKEGTAEEVYSFTLAQFENTEKLYKENAVSNDVYEQAKTGLKVKEDDVKATKELKKQAETEVNRVNKIIADSTLISLDEGIIADVLYKDNEIVAAGYPVVFMRSESQIVKVGVSSKDIDKVEIGMDVNISYLDKLTKGKIIYINEIPNTETLCYDIEIILSENLFRIGNIVDVDIIIGEKTGMWIPLNALQYDGRSYIYAVENSIVKKIGIDIIKSKGDEVLVTNLSEDTQIVIENMSYIKEGNKVQIMSE